MKIWSKLQNPFALVAQGFVVGGLAVLDDPRRRGRARLLAALQLS